MHVVRLLHPRVLLFADQGRIPGSGTAPTTPTRADTHVHAETTCESILINEGRQNKSSSPNLCNDPSNLSRQGAAGPHNSNCSNHRLLNASKTLTGDPLDQNVHAETDFA